MPPVENGVMPQAAKADAGQPAQSGRGLPIGAVAPPNFDVWSSSLILLEHKRLIIVVTLAVTALAVASVLQMDPQFTATAIILPPAPQRANIAALLGQAGTAVQGMSWMGSGDLMRSPADVYVGLLGSRSVADGIIEGRKLLDHYKAKTMTDARRRLAGATSTAAGKDSLVRITVRDRSPEMSSSIANGYIEELQKLTARFALVESSQRRQFFEKQLQNEKQQLASAETEMRGTQEKTGLLQVSSQVEATIRSVAQLRAEITSREVMLQGLSSGATDQNPEVIRMKEELSTLREQLRRLDSRQTAGDPSGTILPAGKVPAAGLAYVRALREVRYHESLFEVLSRQYEAARIDEARQSNVVQVVDYATVPDIKSGPRRTLLVLVTTFSGLLLACAFVLFRHNLRESGTTPRLREVWHALQHWK